MGRKTVEVPRTGGQVADIPLEQILPDPNQPRRTFSKTKLEELSGSIASQGMQQIPTVNRAFVRDGVQFYYINAGERRLHAHRMLHRPTMQCLVQDARYDGSFNLDRKLAQAAENSSREPHTHGEIIILLTEIVAAERAKLGREHGSGEVALGRLAVAFGKSRAWAINYQKLTRLHPELRTMLDDEDETRRLNFSVACTLSQVPMELQQQILEQAKPLKNKGGHTLMLQFISRQAMAVRDDRGIPQRGRRPSDDRAALQSVVSGLYRLAMKFYAERHTSEHRAFVTGVLGQMRTTEVDRLLHEINQAMVAFVELQTAVKQRRETLYAGLRAVSNR